MPYCWMGLVAFALVLTLFPVRAFAEVVCYFEGTRSDLPAPSGLCVRVISVSKALPADRAGIKVGDIIIGLDGQRFRTMTEFAFLRAFQDQREGMLLTIVRDGKVMDINMPSVLAGRRGGMSASDYAIGTEAKAVAWALSWEDIFGLSPPLAGPSAASNAAPPSVAALGLPNASVWVQPFVSIKCFPARGCDAIRALRTRPDPAVKEWVVQLMRVFDHLLYERYDEADALIRKQRLLEKKIDPFLDRLVLFYKALIDHRISAKKGVPMDLYEVDIPFFALCYPYPVLREESKIPFARNPAFQKLFYKASSGSHGFDEELAAVALAEYSEADTEPNTDHYLKQVIRSLLDEQRHGGWPCNSELVRDEKTCRQVLSELLLRLRTNPTNATEIALAALAPALILNDEAAFRDAYSFAAGTGGLVSGFANAIVRATRRWWRLDPDQFRNIQLEIDGRRGKSDFYRYLQTASPGFNYRASEGYYIRYGTFVQDLNSFCSSRPYLVAKAIESPLDATRLEGLVETALRNESPAEVQDALRACILYAGFVPTEANHETLLSLGKVAGIGPLRDAEARMFAWQGDNGEIIPDLKTDWELRDVFFFDMEHAYYERSARCLLNFDKNDPSLTNVAADLYFKAGVPTICLLIANRLKEAGLTTQAMTYEDKAVGFYVALVNAYGGRTGGMALHDLVSAPGFEGAAQQFLPRSQEGKETGEFVMTAILDSYRGDMTSVLENLAKSARPGLDARGGAPFLYRGQIFYSPYSLRLQLMADLLAKKAFSDSQIQRLRSMPALHLDTALDAADD